MAKKILVAGLAAVALLAGCGGGGGDSGALRKEVADLRQQVAATSTSVPATTVTTAVLTPTSGPPVAATTKPPTPTTQRVTTTTQRPTTTTAPPPTTTTTFKGPQGTVTWALSQSRGPTPTANNCMLLTYTIFNRSDSALKDVTLANVYNQETYVGSDGSTQNRWGNPIRFPEQKVAAGIAPFGQADVSANWCPTITPGTTSEFPVNIGEGRQGTTLTTALSWNWFETYPNTSNNFGSCCAWWDSSTKSGHQ